MLRSSRSAVTVVSRLTISGTIQSQSRIHTSIAVSKVKKNEKKKDASTVLHAVSSLHSSDSFVQKALAEMTEVERILKDELAKHFSLQVDLRVYEDITVKLENGQERKMSYLGRVSLKNSQLVMISFADNPSAIKWAKLALQKSHLSVTPQHEGVVLYIQIPRMSRERREQLAHEAKGKIFNEYKRALNDIYIRFDKQSSQQSLKTDSERITRNALLDMKRAMETRGSQLIEIRRKELLTEVA